MTCPVHAQALPAERHDKPTATPEWRALHRIQDIAHPRLRRAFLRAVAATQGEMVLAEVQRLIAAGDADAAAAAIPWEGTAEPVLKSEMLRILRDVFDDSGGVSAKRIPGASFSVVDPRGLQYMQQHGAELVTEITDATRAGLRETLTTMVREGMSANRAARLIRAQIGLTGRLSRAVDRFRADLVERGFSASDVDRYAAAKAAGLRNFRALTIARTEAAIASGEGQHEAWEQAADQGRFDRDVAVRVWVTTPDDLSDHDPPNCADFDGLTTPFNQPFSASGITISRPPIHPGCRCSVALRPGG